ncbi:rRNA maturation RNase YbeY [Hyphobacterium sp.]|uniref:rRNA maturation RNase YbeY n=1 Tax=Hyphobacterium sp. TaxID=2004662 RepID=UPI003BAB6445
MSAVMPRIRPEMAEIDILVEAGGWPEAEELRRLTSASIVAAEQETRPVDSALSVVFADDAAVLKLNSAFRQKDQPTNVLSFPAATTMSGQLGDIALARETVFREAEEKSIPVSHHISHLVIHGFLHLLGHDHQTEVEAEEMEALERRALKRLNIADPYQERGNG